MARARIADEFYVYLNSKSNLKEFRDNTPSCFTNIIKPTIHLTDEYQVALENIIFPSNLIKIRKNDERYFIKLKIEFVDSKGRGTPNAILNYIPSIDISQNNISDIISELNIDFYNQLIKNKIFNEIIALQIVEFPQPIFMYDKVRDKITFYPIPLAMEASRVSRKITWEFSENMSKVIGVSPREQTRPIPVCMLSPIIPNKYDYFFVYSDIVEPTTFAHQNISLLDILPIGDVYSKNGSIKLYKTLNKNVIDNISIKIISSQTGELVRFNSNIDLILVLHFKKLE